VPEAHLCQGVALCQLVHLVQWGFPFLEELLVQQEALGPAADNVFPFIVLDLHDQRAGLAQAAGNVLLLIVADLHDQWVGLAQAVSNESVVVVSALLFRQEGL
jgi:hypothetical protein